MKRSFILSILLSLFLLSACVIRHAVPSQNTPCFTDKNQFEGVCSFGISGASINLAYSPIKYLSLQANGYSTLTSYQSPLFNNQVEAAIGAYYPFRNLIVGLNLGYGAGSVVWSRWYAVSYYEEHPDHSEFDTKKKFMNAYFAYLPPQKKIYAGLSFKAAMLKEFYHRHTTDFEGRYKTGNYGTNFSRTSFSYELVHYMKIRLRGSLYLTHEEGIQISDYPHIIARIGCMLKF